MTARITVWNRLGYAVMRAALAVVGVLPEGLAYRVVGWAGQTYVRFSNKRQKCWKSLSARGHNRPFSNKRSKNRSP